MALIKTSAQGLTADATNFVLLSSVTASDDTNIIFDSSLITDTYDFYKLIVTRYVPATDGANVRIVCSSDNGSTYISTNYGRVAMFATRSDTNNSKMLYKTGEVSTAQFAGAGNAMGALNRENTTAIIDMLNFRSSTLGKHFIYSSSYETSGGSGAINTGTVYLDDASVINNIKLENSSGNFESGKFSFYGVKT